MAVVHSGWTLRTCVAVAERDRRIGTIGRYAHKNAPGLIVLGCAHPHYRRPYPTGHELFTENVPVVFVSGFVGPYLAPSVLDAPHPQCARRARWVQAETRDGTDIHFSGTRNLSAGDVNSIAGNGGWETLLLPSPPLSLVQLMSGLVIVPRGTALHAMLALSQLGVYCMDSEQLASLERVGELKGGRPFGMHAAAIRLRGGVSKYYNISAPPKRGGIFIEPGGGVEDGEGQSEWNKGGWAFEERDLTAFCKQRLGHLAGQIVCTDGVVIHFSNVSGVIGHALVTFRQGRKRAGVNWDQVGKQSAGVLEHARGER